MLNCISLSAAEDGKRAVESAIPLMFAFFGSIPQMLRMMAVALVVATLLIGGLASRVSAQTDPVKPVPVVEPDRSAAVRVPPDEETRSSAISATSGFTFYAYSDTKLELYYDGGAQFFGGRASGLLLWIDDEVYGPGNIPAGIAHMPYTPLGQTLTGDGSFSNPWVVTTTVAAGNTGVKLQSILRYQNGNRIIQLRTTVLNETSTPRNVTLFHAGDIYLQIGNNLPDYGYGTYRAANSAVGATTSSGDFAFLFEPVNLAPTSYQEGNFAELWKAIGGTKPGPGFNRTFRTGYHDAGAGLQWSLWLTANTSRTVAHQLRLEPIDLTTLDPQTHAPNIEDWSDATPLSRRRFVEMYGGGACPASGECKLDPIAERWYLDNFAFAGALGRCFGLSTMSTLFYRDIYHAHDFDVNATVPYSLTRPNAALEERITIYQTLQSDFQVSYPLASTRFNLSPSEIYARIKAELSNNNLDPYLITVYGQISTQGLTMWGAPRWEWAEAGHTLVPYRIENMANDVHLVFVYDPNYPGSRERAITFDLVNNTWEYPMGANTRPSGSYGAPGYWAGNAVNRNIGIVNTSAGTGTRPPLPHQKSSGSDWFWLAADPDWKGNLIIANDAGARVGVADGALMHEISGTVPIIPLNYVLRPAAPSYFVPKDNYRVVLEPAENVPVVTQLRYLGPGFGFFADSIDLAPTSRITMAMQAASPAMTLSSNDATQSIDLTYGYSFTANSPAGRVIKLAGVELGAGSHITTSLNVTNHVVHLGAGGSAKVYDLNITTAGTALAEPARTFEHWNIVVAPHTRHRLDLSMMDAAGVVSLTVTDAHGNVIEDRYLKNNRSDASSYTLAAARTGAGVGRVTGSPAGIDCGNQCAASYAHGLQVELTATADVSSHFTGWNGACTGSAAVCSFRIYETSLVTATFEINSYPLTLTTAGAGKVLVNPDGVMCGSQCVSQYLHGTMVSLVATADPGASFKGWGGACTGTDPICQVGMNSAKDVTATFYPNSYPLTVTTAGTGMVSIAPTGDLCEGECTSTFLDGTVVTLEAKPAAGASFAGWGGACTGNDRVCEVTIKSASAVQAKFNLNVYALTVTTTGAGTGTVHVTPGDTSCGVACVATLPYGTEVMLEAIPAAGSDFTGWFGVCTGDRTVCRFTLRAAVAATASFDGQPGAALFIPLVTK